MSTRRETDSMGEIEVPVERMWGAQTARAAMHFDIGDDRMPLEIIHAIALVKKAAAQVNADFGLLDPARAALIVRAADEVISGQWDAEFPLKVWQSGSGTQTNMNVNEVIANRANELAGSPRGRKEPVHPNDHVNRSQSTNDVFPTAMHIASVRLLHTLLLPQITRLRDALAEKAKSFDGIVKIGRTHLQDATPLTVPQEVSGWISLLERDQERIHQALNGLLDLAIGGSAVGTGLNSHPEYASHMAAKIAELTGFPFRSHPNKFAALSAHDEAAFASSALRTLAGSLMKIANDIRWLASGPRCGLGEMRLPENEPGSSMMPGKVNPTQCEALTMVAVQVYGNDAAIALAASQGNFQLNVFKPVIARNLLHSIRLLGDACRSFVDHSITSLDVDRERIDWYVRNSLMLVTALVPRIGYDQAAKAAQTAYREGISLRDACVRLGSLTADEYDRLVQPDRMTSPSV